MDSGDLAFRADGEVYIAGPAQGPDHQGGSQPRPAGDRGGRGLGRRHPQGMRGGLRRRPPGAGDREPGGGGRDPRRGRGGARAASRPPSSSAWRAPSASRPTWSAWCRRAPCPRRRAGRSGGRPPGSSTERGARAAAPGPGAAAPPPPRRGRPPRRQRGGEPGADAWPTRSTWPWPRCSSRRPIGSRWPCCRGGAWPSPSHARGRDCS